MNITQINGLKCQNALIGTNLLVPTKIGCNIIQSWLQNIALCSVHTIFDMDPLPHSYLAILRYCVRKAMITTVKFVCWIDIMLLFFNAYMVLQPVNKSFNVQKIFVKVQSTPTHVS